MRQNKNTWFYIGGSGLDRTDDFQKFCRQDWIGFNFIGSGLDSNSKISQHAHLWLLPPLVSHLFELVSKFRSGRVLVLQQVLVCVGEFNIHCNQLMSETICYPYTVSTELPNCQWLIELFCSYINNEKLVVLWWTASAWILNRWF